MGTLFGDREHNVFVSDVGYDSYVEAWEAGRPCVCLTTLITWVQTVEPAQDGRLRVGLWLTDEQMRDMRDMLDRAISSLEKAKAQRAFVHREES